MVSPDSLPEIDRPPLRLIDQYVKPEIPCLTKRSTVAFLACLGFIVMFGMRCNMGVAKLELMKIVSKALRTEIVFNGSRFIRRNCDSCMVLFSFLGIFLQFFCSNVLHKQSDENVLDHFRKLENWNRSYKT